MIIELTTLLGTITGGLFRLAPEILKIFDRGKERDHEHRMLSANLEADRLRAEWGYKIAEMEGDTALGIEEYKALIAGVEAQAKPTGIRWVDAVNGLMRPLITFWWVIVLYTAYLTSGFIALIMADVPVLQAIGVVFGTEEKTIASSIISFWFVDRAIRHMGRL